MPRHPGRAAPLRSACWLVLVVLGACRAEPAVEPGTRGNGAVLSEVTTGRYRVGQIWRFRARPGEEAATLTVVKVESSPTLGVIVHVNLQGLRIRSARNPGGLVEAIQHAPFSEEAIARSVTELAGTAQALPAFEEGYRQWRRALEAGEARVSTVTVAEAVAIAESAVNR